MASSPAHEREVRGARNQSLFRAINEKIMELSAARIRGRAPRRKEEAEMAATLVVYVDVEHLDPEDVDDLKDTLAVAIKDLPGATPAAPGNLYWTTRSIFEERAEPYSSFVDEHERRLSDGR